FPQVVEFFPHFVHLGLGGCLHKNVGFTKWSSTIVDIKWVQVDEDIKGEYNTEGANFEYLKAMRALRALKALVKLQAVIAKFANTRKQLEVLEDNMLIVYI
ncbi:hypothetical protein Tco_1424625, partial [Tanacetum coccineum]